MFDELQDAVNLLDWVEIEMMLWSNREGSKKKKEKLEQYISVIEKAIGIIEDFDAGFDEEQGEEE